MRRVSLLGDAVIHVIQNRLNPRLSKCCLPVNYSRHVVVLNAISTLS